MKWNKEILAIITSLLLLAALVINWGYNVYLNKITALQAESNIIFFEALETAKERMFLKKTIRPTLVRSKDGVTEFNFENTFPSADSLRIEHTKNNSHSSRFPRGLIEKEAKIFGFRTDSLTNHFNQEEALKKLYKGIWDEINLDDGFVKFADDTTKSSIKNAGIKFTLTDDNGEIFLHTDTIIIVDFDTTQTYLENVFIEKMDTANLKQLKVKVYDFEDLKAQDVKASFTTNPGKLGDVFFGRKTYAATVQNFGPIALRKMIPEMLFGLFLYGLIATAFLIIYRSLNTQRKLVKIKDEFVGNITHELKTPISVVNVAIEAIQNFEAGKDPEKTKRYLDISKKELNRLSGLVDKVLHLAVDPTDKAPTEQVDISELTSQVVDSMQIRLTDLPISIELDAPDEPIYLNANISQVKSVIYNLIDNAIKYSSGGKVSVTIENLNARFLQIKIADQGIGIPKAFQDKIFDQFFRVPSNNIHNVKGYGLGLHNVRQIVERYNGKITLKSEEGIGSIFTIKWPKTNG